MWIKDGGGDGPGQDRAWEKGRVEEGAGLGIEGGVGGGTVCQLPAPGAALAPTPRPAQSRLEWKLPSQILV